MLGLSPSFIPNQPERRCRVRKLLVVGLMLLGLLFFFSLALAQEVPDSLSNVYGATIPIEPLGPDFAPAPGLEPCGEYFLVTPKGTSFPQSIIMFLDRFKDIKLECSQRVFLNSVRVTIDTKHLAPRARLNYQAGWVTAEVSMPANKLDDCPCLKARLSIPLK